MPEKYLIFFLRGYHRNSPLYGGGGSLGYGYGQGMGRVEGRAWAGIARQGRQARRIG